VHGYWLGSYEWEKRRLFETLVRPGDVVYDIGANVGFYTILASRLVGPLGRVIAFEPLPRNLEFLKRHVTLNDASNVTVYEAAVWDRSGSSQFDAGGDRSVGRVHEEGSTCVATVKLDELLESQSLPPPSLIKMDIEGGELRALRGAAGLLRLHRPSILLATHGPIQHAGCYDFLAERGYDLQPLVRGRPVREVDELMAISPSMRVRGDISPPTLAVVPTLDQRQP
jgi:FkbM family methyltransferase